MRLMVEDGQQVEAGDQLYEGPLNPHELLHYRGALGTAQYMVGEVQKVYKSRAWTSTTSTSSSSCGR